MKKLFKIATCLMLIVGISSTPVFANGQISTNTIEEISVDAPSSNATTSNYNTSQAFENAMQPHVDQATESMNQYTNVVFGEHANVTTEDISQRIIRKAYEVADLFRAVAIPIVIATFVVSIISAIWGAVSTRKTVVPGLLGMLFSGIGIVLIIYAPQILLYFGKWIWS